MINLLNLEKIIIIVLVVFSGFLYISNSHYKNKVADEKLNVQACNNSIDFAGYLAEKSLKDASLALDKTAFSLRVARDSAKGIGEGADVEIKRLEALEIVNKGAQEAIDSIDIMINESLKL